MNKNILIPDTLLTDWALIDQGHFGSVFKAKHTVYRVHVAVKKLKRNVPHSLKELISEAEKMASASASPYVIHLIGFIEENKQGPPGIVMEYMQNGSLCTLMEKVSPIPWALKYRIILQVTLGMNWLHNLPTPLLHLDLKTKNVLLNEELHIKITDFGLSKYTSCSAACGSEDCVGGTLEYMPPEAFQEGYQPSTSTDVYSFAILSAVVLRGQNPYPVDKSVLIRELVPRGQRPCLQALENETSVKYLNEATEFIKRCWDNDKLKRPPFTECCKKWEEFLTAFTTFDIKQAVRQVQDNMDSSVSSGKTTDHSYRGDTASVNTKDMSEMVHKFQTMNVSARPSALPESVPAMSYRDMQSQPTETLLQGYLEGAVGSNSRPQAIYYPVSVPVTSSPNMQSRPTMVHPETLPRGYLQRAAGSNNRRQPPYYQGFPQFVYQRFTGNLPQPYFNFSPISQPKPATINIHNSSNFQIGDNVTMNVTDKAYPGQYQNVNYGPPCHTTRNHYPTPMKPQQTSQEYYNRPAREASSDHPCKQETAVKSDQQSHMCPVQTTPEGHFSNACNTQVTQGSMSTTEKPTTQHPGQ